MRIFAPSVLDSMLKTLAQGRRATSITVDQNLRGLYERAQKKVAGRNLS